MEGWRRRGTNKAHAAMEIRVTMRLTAGDLNLKAGTISRTCAWNWGLVRSHASKGWVGGRCVERYTFLHSQVTNDR